MPENYILATKPIKAYFQGPDGTMHEFEAGAIHFDSVDLDKDVTIHPEAFAKIRFSVTLRRWKHKDLVRLKQTFGILRVPRCAFRTNKETINRRRYNGHKRPAK